MASGSNQRIIVSLLLTGSLDAELALRASHPEGKSCVILRVLLAWAGNNHMNGAFSMFTLTRSSFRKMNAGMGKGQLGQNSTVAWTHSCYSRPTFGCYCVGRLLTKSTCTQI